MPKSLIKELYSASAFKKIGITLIEQLSTHLNETITAESKKTIEWNEPEKELQFWKDFFDKGKNKDLTEEILKRTTHTHNPKYVGHQVSATAPITGLTNLLSSMLNNGMAVYEMGMSPSAIEKIVTDSICKKIGYDENSAGFLTSGGTLANLTALLSARKAMVTHDVWNKGYSGPLGIMVSGEAHYCVDRAAKIMGLGEKGIRKIPVNQSFAVDISKLENCYQNAKKEGIEIFAIVGSSPSTATGAYDNLNAISEFAKQKQIWFHVDGAHGGAAIYSKKYSYLLDGIQEADSVVIDGHKMMLMPALTTALLFKNKWHSQHTFSQKADYLLDDAEEEHWINSGKKTFECTKTMMCLHWFILLKYYGEELFDEFVTNQYDLARDFAKLLTKDASFELAVEPQSNILCFRMMKLGMSKDELNAFNLQIRKILLEDGEYYLVQTKLNGVQYLRTTLMNPFTTIAHLSRLMEKIKKVGNSLS